MTDSPTIQAFSTAAIYNAISGVRYSEESSAEATALTHYFTGSTKAVKSTALKAALAEQLPWVNSIPTHLTGADRADFAKHKAAIDAIIATHGDSHTVTPLEPSHPLVSGSETTHAERRREELSSASAAQAR